MTSKKRSRRKRNSLYMKRSLRLENRRRKRTPSDSTKPFILPKRSLSKRRDETSPQSHQTTLTWIDRDRTFRQVTKERESITLLRKTISISLLLRFLQSSTKATLIRWEQNSKTSLLQSIETAAPSSRTGLPANSLNVAPLSSAKDPSNHPSQSDQTDQTSHPDLQNPTAVWEAEWAKPPSPSRIFLTGPPQKPLTRRCGSTQPEVKDPSALARKSEWKCSSPNSMTWLSSSTRRTIRRSPTRTQTTRLTHSESSPRTPKNWLSRPQCWRLKAGRKASLQSSWCQWGERGRRSMCCLCRETGRSLRTFCSESRM